MHAAGSDSTFVIANSPFLYLTRLTGTFLVLATFVVISRNMLPLPESVSALATSKYRNPLYAP
jgi:hypothetical protein